MKKIKCILLALLLPFAALAQPATITPTGSGLAITNNDPIPVGGGEGDTNTPTITGGFQQILAAIGNNTNLLWEVHGLYASGLQKKLGGGVGAVYPISTYVFTSIRLDWVNGGFWMPQGSVGLQLPLHPFSWLTITPFTYAGIAVPVSGATVGSVTVPGQTPRDNNGQPTAILGAGGAINLYAKWHLNLVGDLERWTGFPGNQYRIGATFGLH